MCRTMTCSLSSSSQLSCSDEGCLPPASPVDFAFYFIFWPAPATRSVTFGNGGIGQRTGVSCCASCWHFTVELELELVVFEPLSRTLIELCLGRFQGARRKTSSRISSILLKCLHHFWLKSSPTLPP